MTYQHPEKWQKAVAKMILNHPFFASLYLRLHVRPETRIPTCGINNKVLLYNPAFVEKHTVDELVTIICHEVLHLAMCHPMRRGHRDMKKANVAGDYSINLMLKDAGLDMPEEGLLDEQYRTDQGNVLAMEQIYDRLPVEEPDDGGGEGDEQDGDEPSVPGEGGKGKGKGKGDGQTSNGDGESGESGQSGQGDQPNAPDPGGMGAFMDCEDEDGNSLSEQELTQEIAEMEVAVQQAAQAAKACGNLPASIKALVDEMNDHVMDWREVLRHFIQKTARDSYNWNYPNRRHIGDGDYLPSRRGDELKPILVAFDNSGSVSDRELARFGAELNGILGDSYPCNVTTAEFDTSINHDNVQDYTHEDYPIKLVRTRCGGTSFGPVFDFAEEEATRRGQEWAAVLVMTDMCASMPTNEPHCPVLWVSTMRSHAEVNFGEVAYIM